MIPLFLFSIFLSGCQTTQSPTSGQTTATATASATASAMTDDAAKRAEQKRQAKLQSHGEAMSNGAQLMASADFREAAKYFQEAVSIAKDLADQAKENDAREKVITAVQSLSVAPAIPEEARRYGIRGEAIMNSAKKTADFRRAVTEFEAAATIAPWWGSAYYNLGLVREGAKDAIGAIAAFALFLKAEPGAPEAAAIRDRMYALEVAAEEQEQTVWTGYWTTGVNTFYAEIKNGFFVFTVASVDSRDTDFGLAPGQIAFKGEFNNESVNGKRTWDQCSAFSNRAQCEKCIGKVGSYKASAILHRENDILELKFNDIMSWGYKTKRCSPLEKHPVTLTTYFMRLDSPN